MTTSPVASLDSSPAKSDVFSRLRSSVDQVVGSVFYGKLLETMRKSPLKAKLGHGGRGEDAFGAQLDQQLAERAGQARSYNLNEAIYHRLAKQQRRIGNDPQRTQKTQNMNFELRTLNSVRPLTTDH